MQTQENIQESPANNVTEEQSDIKNFSIQVKKVSNSQQTAPLGVLIK
jgi:hypothetical protein